MSTTTTNYGLIKPDTTDPILIGQLNDNSDAIDAALKENADAIENKPDAADIPSPSTAAPAMDGTASPGTSEEYARSDHIHPSDTSKQDALTTAQLAAANSGIDSTKVEQIETNKNNILTIADQTTRYNLLNNIATSKTDNNVTLTVNADKSVTVSTDGAASANTFVELTDGWELTSKYEGCTVSGAAIGSDINACIYVAYSNNGSSEATSFRLYEQKPTALVSSNYTYIKILVIVISGKTISSPITFKPMITPTPLYNAGFTNYQPYAMSNVELTAAIQALQAQLANQ